MRAQSRASRVVAVVGFVSAVSLLAACAGGEGAPIGANADDNSTAADGSVVLEFSQWWEPELPKGSLRGMMDEFEKANPGVKVKLISAPYASTQQQTVAGAASKTLADVVGLDGAWVNDFSKQKAITNLTSLMQESGYDDSQLASQIKVDGNTYMIPVVNFVYPMFTNDTLLAKAGVNAPPSTRSEFVDAAKKVTATGKGNSGWILPLAQDAPNGIQNDVMSWVWASGGSMLKDGQPDLTNSSVKSVVEFIKQLNDAKAIAPGALTMKEQDKVEQFTNGRVGMMIDSLAHINLIRENAPDLKFSISAIPAADGYTGKRGMPYASWGIGVSENSKHKKEALKLVEFLMSKDTNSKLSSVANAFPGNKESVPDFVQSDAMFKTAFDIWNKGVPANEFTGLPTAEDLMRSFDGELQKTLAENQPVDTTLNNAQKAWSAKF
ncbi:sugar ABC transporter substrate-binding protein [Phycicoccus sp. Root563]|uniref:ABC transporter substrate-binding protein n=1 Tax=unclassified Phycicoccus TaxID=2637926 RepID=UPI000703B5DC|nr:MULTISPECIES: sugar ABC transporter substrate-binding protein [unclassified Phycicoccus]KQU67569.1 sugar ABC transporter substrate-binding protein [Phycicoccus sp. Root101]KQZ90247.1 sugar ABC transporter substrate-binding protein [Phycicoccus sp. Root563]